MHKTFMNFVNMAGMDQKYDSALMGILSSEGEIYTFLDVVLGFLYRRTDYFRILSTEDDKIGFRPGVASQILQRSFMKYAELAASDEQGKKKVVPNKTRTTSKTSPKISEAIATTKTDTTTTKITAATIKTATTTTKTTAATIKAATTTTKKAGATTTPTESQIGDTDSSEKQSDSQEQKDLTAETSAGEATIAEASAGEATTAEDKTENTEETRQQAEFQKNPISYNGAVRENYAWAQSITDVDVRVFVPDSIKKGKQVKVVIEKKHLRVSYTDSENEKHTPFDGEFPWDVNKEECMWTLIPGEHVHVNLEKREERWWDAAMMGEQKINVRKIDCSRPMTDLDEEAHAKIGEMMYNQEQKRLGLPQSHEQKSYDMLKQAWNAEGSPFSGQPYDPSVITSNSSGVFTIKDK